MLLVVLVLPLFKFLALITILLKWYWEYRCKLRHLNKHSEKVPGPKGWPLIGNILDFIGGPNEIYDIVMKHFNSYPHLGKIWYGPILIYGVSKPEYLAKVLSSPKALSKMHLFQKHTKEVLGDGLLTANVPTWKKNRKLILPMFNQKILEGFVEIFGRQCSVMVENLEKSVDEDEIDVFQVVTRFTTDIICETAMGVQVHAQKGQSEFGLWIDKILEIMIVRMYVIWYQFDFIFKWTHLYQKERQLIRKFNSFTEKVIKEKLAASRRNHSKPKAFLDLLIQQSVGENKLTIDEIRNEVNTFLIAGSDTTATTNCFILTMLGMHPEIQKLVYQEVIDILGPDLMIEPTDLPLLKYTERVIKETLRLFPNGPFLMRDIAEDLELEDDIFLPKGSSVILGIIHVHRSSEYWLNPLTFDPDRFLPEEVAKRHPFCYLPFSGGPRNCIGLKYAMMAMKTMVASVIRRFEFSTSYRNVDEMRLKVNVVLRPVDGFKVSVKKRV